MQESKHSVKLSRRLVGVYLLFGLLSVIVFAIAMAFSLQANSRNSAEDSLLTHLTSSAKQITDLLDANPSSEGIGSVIQELVDDRELIFCAVVDADGIFIAHSTPSLAGKRSALGFGLSTSLPGAIERISHLQEDGGGAREYWIPLRNERKSFGLLQAAVTSSDDSGSYMELIQRHSSLSLILPLLLLVFGGNQLRNVISTSSIIEQQLARLIEDDDFGFAKLSPVEPRGNEALGWNLLVAKASQAESMDSLESRLTEVLGGCRESRYQQILESLQDGVALCDKDGSITYANETFGRLLEQPLSKVMGASVPSLLPEGDGGNDRRFAAQANKQLRPAVVEIWKSSEMVDGVFRLSRTPLFSEDGNLVSQLWSFRDVTHQRLIEQTRDQFVETATHELRTPLSTIRACAEALDLHDDIDMETQKLYINTINNESIRLGRFVDEFLNVSRMEAGSLSLNRHNTHLEKLLRESVDKIRPAVEMKNIEMDVVLPPKLPELNIDKDKISAALMNLLGNAEKYTPEGGQIKLIVEVKETEVRIHVEDSGLGISEEELPRVFAKFFRSDDERVRKITGTGLGLSFAQEVVRLHGGNLSATSEINKGSRFSMMLPLVGTGGQDV